MKKLLSIMLVGLLGLVALTADARSRSTRDVYALPVAARDMLSKNFKAQVSHIKIDSKTFGGTEYDVVLRDGTEVEFNSKGEWTEVDCGHRQVPQALILKPIQDYVKTNFKGRKIVQISVEPRKYEIELSDGTDLEFDRSGRFLRMDY